MRYTNPRLLYFTYLLGPIVGFHFRHAHRLAVLCRGGGVFASVVGLSVISRITENVRNK